MKIRNITRQNFLAQEADLAQDPFSRMKGLLGRKDLPKDHALIIRPCNQVHMFFMRFPIDVLFVDKNNIVVGLVENIKPGHLSPIFFGSHFVIELPSGVIQVTSTQIKDKLELI
jgi:uncharacterized protein